MADFTDYAGPLAYKKGYKYQVTKDYQFLTGILDYEVETDWLSLDKHGLLIVKKGYAWDGPSGPAIDTQSMMRPSLLHDAGYDMLRHDLLPQRLRFKFDQLFHREILTSLDRIYSGCGKVLYILGRVRAAYAFVAVHWCAASAAKRENRRKVLTAL